MDISAIDTLEAIVDGDTIVPGMNFVLPSGVGKTQYYNPSTKVCTPDYSQRPIRLPFIRLVTPVAAVSSLFRTRTM